MNRNCILPGCQVCLFVCVACLDFASEMSIPGDWLLLQPFTFVVGRSAPSLHLPHNLRDLEVPWLLVYEVLIFSALHLWWATISYHTVSACQTDRSSSFLKDDCTGVLFVEGHYQLRVLPPGILPPPSISTRCMAAALALLQARGGRILPYVQHRWLIVMFPVKGNQGHGASVSHGTQLGVNVNLAESIHLHVFWFLADDSPLPPREDNILLHFIKLWYKRTGSLNPQCFCCTFRHFNLLISGWLVRTEATGQKGYGMVSHLPCSHGNIGVCSVASLSDSMISKEVLPGCSVLL